MDLIIKGTNIKEGKIVINGHKHSLVQIIAASIALNQKTLIKNIPIVDDTNILKTILNKCGVIYELNKKDKTLFVDSSNISNYEIDEKDSKRIHGSMYLIPAIFSRLNKKTYFASGGCQIGDSENNSQRPSSHIYSICEESSKQSGESFNIDIKQFSDKKGFLSGALISSATKIAILIGLRHKVIKIKNPYLKTDVLDLLSYLSACGLKIKKSRNCIKIINNNNVDKCINYSLSDCQSEVMTYITMALLKNIKLKILIRNYKNIKRQLKNEFEILKKMGVNISIKNGFLIVEKKKKLFNPVNIYVKHKTIQSDHHPFFTLLLLNSYGVSEITEYVWKDRFSYVEELKKLGANIERNKNKITIYPSQLKETKDILIGCDTRASAVLTLASLSIKGKTYIKEADHLNRGYDNFIENLIILGCEIERC